MELEYRPIDYLKDLPEVTELIVNNLDKNYTTDFFKWKHLENPFGESYGLVATDGGKIVGLRMFMFWNFHNGVKNKTVIAIRPVDTVVDYNYRGQGLFRKLTLKGLEICKGRYDLIFNTPNENSLPGYLQMGWEYKNPKYFKIGILLPSISKSNVEFGDVPQNINSESNVWETLKNRSYLRWRFQDENYKISKLKGSYIIYSTSKINNLNQVVIQEVFGKKTDLKKLLGCLAKIENAFLFYYYANDLLEELFLFKFKRKKSVVVIKDDSLQINDKIIFSLGDLEGKL